MSTARTVVLFTQAVLQSGLLEKIEAAGKELGFEVVVTDDPNYVASTQMAEDVHARRLGIAELLRPQQDFRVWEGKAIFLSRPGPAPQAPGGRWPHQSSVPSKMQRMAAKSRR